MAGNNDAESTRNRFPFPEREQALKTGLCVAGLALVLSWPMIYNGYPYMFSGDSYAYLTESLNWRPIWGRASFYSYFTAVHLTTSVWIVGLAQATILASSIYLCLHYVARLKMVAVFLIGGFVGGITAAAWYAGLITPDVFSPILILFTIAIAFGGPELRPPARWIVYVVYGLAVLVHGSHVTLVPMLVVVSAAALVWRDRTPRAARPILPLGLVYLAALGVLTVHNGFVNSTFTPAAEYGSTYMFAWLYEEGLAAPVLEELCETDEVPTLCEISTEPFPARANAIIFGSRSPLRSGGHHQSDFDGETRKVVVEVLLHDPIGYLRAGTRNSWEQLWRQSDIASGDGFLRPKRDEATLHRVFEPIGDVTSYTGSRQYAGTFQMGALDRSHRYTWRLGAILSLVSLGVAMYRRDRYGTALLAVVVVSLPIHAAATGFLSASSVRYGARAAWIPALLALGLLASQIGRWTKGEPGGSQQGDDVAVASDATALGPGTGSRSAVAGPDGAGIAG